MANYGNSLGDYLRARRDQVRPEDVGLVAGPRRRVRGLRREELATLAGISSEYYLRLEQGRDKHPSPQILAALALALQLDVKASAYLDELVYGRVRDDHPDAAAEVAADGLDALIEQFPMPAIVANRYQDVLAANAMAQALSTQFRPGENFLRWRLVDPAAKDFFRDWEDATENAVRGLREVAGGAPEDPRMRALVSEFCSISDRFRQLWARADVGYCVGTTRVRHSAVGPLELQRNRLTVPHSVGQHVIIYRAEPGSASARALDKLRRLT
ncbi:MAG: helix-turn-helix domain-containing protein [Mycobacterium sp.]